jgi:hypothetical protein
VYAVISTAICLIVIVQESLGALGISSFSIHVVADDMFHNFKVEVLFNVSHPGYVVNQGYSVGSQGLTALLVQRCAALLFHDSFR